MSDVRTIVIEALDNATGFMNNSEHFALVRDGGHLDLAMLDIDSLSQFEILMEIEDALSVELDADEVFSHSSLNALCAWLEAKVAGDAD